MKAETSAGLRASTPRAAIRRGPGVAAAVLAASFLTFGLTRGVLAHALPEAMHPAAGAVLTAPPSQVSIRFREELADMLPKLEVLDAGGHNQAAGDAELSSDHRTLLVRLKQPVPGRFTVKWSVFSVDGHRTEGSYTFTVTGRPRP